MIRQHLAAFLRRQIPRISRLCDWLAPDAITQALDYPVYVGMDMGTGDRSVALACQKRADGTIMVLGEQALDHPVANVVPADIQALLDERQAQMDAADHARTVLPLRPTAFTRGRMRR